MSAASLNIALLVDDINVAAWQYQMVQQIITTRRIHVRLLIIDSSAAPPQNVAKAPLLTRWRSWRNANTPTDTLAYAVATISGFLLQSGLRVLRATDRLWGGTALSPLRRRSLQSLCRPDRVYDLADKQLPAHYAQQAIDVLLQLGRAEPPDWLLAASGHGAWRVFVGGLAQHADSWTGLRQYIAGADQLYSGIVWQQAHQPGQQSASKQCVLLSSGSMHPAFFHRTLEPVLWKMAALLPGLLEQLRDSKAPQTLLTERGQRYAARIAELDALDEPDGIKLPLAFTQPSADWVLLRRAFAQSLRAKGKLLYEKVFLRQTWALLYGEHGKPGDLTGLPRLLPPAGKFWADPQLISYQGRRFVFFEEWVNAQQKGHIVCVEWYGDERFSAVAPVLEEAYHLSYPHVFEFSGDYYMVPESADNKTVSLYRCLRFPDRWEFVHHLMEGVAAYDATLYKHAGRWWMFVNLRHHPDSSSDDLLYLYSADSPLSQQWQSHPANPIVSEVASARSAGRILRLGNKLYRPSQNCAGSYGRGLNLNRIVRWNAKTYQERTLGQYIPDGTDSLYGLHTFSMLGHAIFSDGIVRQPLRKPKSWQWINSKAVINSKKRVLQKLYRRK